MEAKSEALIRQIKEIRQQKKITYPAIMEALAADGVPSVSLTTVRRVFAAGSEKHATNFSYENTLLPILEAVNSIAGESDNLAEEIKHCRDEVIQRFDSQLADLKQQIADKDALIKRLIDRLDQKDDIIHQFITDMRQKDEIIRCITYHEDPKD